jgi:hypothetical protein
VSLLSSRALIAGDSIVAPSTVIQPLTIHVAIGRLYIVVYPSAFFSKNPDDKPLVGLITPSGISPAGTEDVRYEK